MYDTVYLFIPMYFPTFAIACKPQPKHFSFRQTPPKKSVHHQASCVPKGFTVCHPP